MCIVIACCFSDWAGWAETPDSVYHYDEHSLLSRSSGFSSCSVPHQRLETTCTRNLCAFLIILSLLVVSIAHSLFLDVIEYCCIIRPHLIWFFWVCCVNKQESLHPTSHHYYYLGTFFKINFLGLFPHFSLPFADLL